MRMHESNIRRVYYASETCTYIVIATLRQCFERVILYEIGYVFLLTQHRIIRHLVIRRGQIKPR